MALIDVPKASVLEVIVINGSLTFNKGRILSGRLVEKKIGDVILISTKEAADHPEFSSFFDRVREIIEERGKNSKGLRVETGAWCHYHKAKIGHTIDTCPDVRCRGCHLLGHTNRVCQTPKCDDCGKYGHTKDTCNRVVCEECGREGHTQDHCYKKLTCEKCSETGHPTEKCRKLEPIPAPVWCSFCEIQGDHPTSSCEDLKYHPCEKCGEKGHFFKNCRVVKKTVTESEKKEQSVPLVFALSSSGGSWADD